MRAVEEEVARDRASIARRLTSRSESQGTCRIWVGHTTPTGYGVIRIKKKSQGAHRIAFLVWSGAIPAGLEVDHLCGRRSCINPDHLQLLTHSQNLLRSKNFVAVNARKTHCLRGHELPPVGSVTRRTCNPCRSIKRAEQREQQESLGLSGAL